MKAKATKRALLLSVLSLLVCVAMLVGTTYAWFTDSVTTGVNSITSGTLSVDIVDESGASLENGTLYFRDVNDETDILWEPGATFELDSFKIVNTGNLHLKYKVELSAFSGDTELLDVIDFTVDGEAMDTYFAAQFDKPLAPAGETGSESDLITIKGTMDSAAGNEYQNKTLNAIKITVYATQLNAEYDSFGNSYDAAATYGTPVSSASELKEALAAGENVVLENDIAVAETISVSKDVTIDLNGKTLESTVTNARPLKVTGDGVDLVLNATGTTTDFGTTSYGVVEMAADVDDATVTINGGTFTGTTNEGTLVRLRGGNNNTIVLNDVTYTDDCVLSADQTNAWAVYTSGSGTGNKLVVNGGTYTVACGFSADSAIATEFKGVTINAVGAAFELKSSSNLIENCTINLDPGAYVYSAIGAGVACSNNGHVTIKNTTIKSGTHATAVYTSGGVIDMVGCTIVSGDHAIYHDSRTERPSFGITMDGVPATVVYPNCGGGNTCDIAAHA